MSIEFRKYDTVKIIEILNPEKTHKSDFNLAAPKAGDIATIVEIFTDPCVGYELECSDKNGITQWLVTFESGEINMVTA